MIPQWVMDLRALTKDDAHQYSMIGVVRSVDSNGITCQVEPVLAPGFLYNTSNLNNCITTLLTADRSGQINNSSIIPRIKSYVIIAFINFDTAYISFYSDVTTDDYELDKYSVITPNLSFIMTGTTITFNQGTSPMLFAEKLVDRVNTLENQVNSILNILKTTTIPLAPAGTYPFAPLYLNVNPLTNTKVDDVSDKKITH
jgi:hypothetical protein